MLALSLGNRRPAVEEPRKLRLASESKNSAKKPLSPRGTQGPNVGWT